MADARDASAVDRLQDISKTAEEQTRNCKSELEKIWNELACCNEEQGVSDALQQEVQQKLDTLRQSSASLKEAHQQTERMIDELSARAKDTRAAVERRWYRANPPSNGSIDLQEREKQHFAQGVNLYKLMLVLFIGSVAGVIIEMLWALLRRGVIESRSCLVWGPFNLLYGMGAVCLSALLYKYRNRGKWLSFLGGMVIGSAVEYVTSWGMEVILGCKSWDYSNIPFNLNGRICLLYSVFWGFLGVLWIKDLYPRMARWILKLPNRAGKVLVWCMAIFLAVNSMISALALWRWSERQEGLAPSNAVEQLMDERFPDQRMEAVYANMVFDQQEDAP